MFRVTGSWGWLCFVLQGLGGGASCVSCYIQSPEDAHFPPKFSPPTVLYADAFVWPLQRQRERERLRLRIPSWLGIRVPRRKRVCVTANLARAVFRVTANLARAVFRVTAVLQCSRGCVTCYGFPSGSVLRVTASRRALCYVCFVLQV